MKKPQYGFWIVAGLSAALVIGVGGFLITQLPPPVSTAADSPQTAAGHASASPSPTGASGGSGGSGASAGSARSGGGPVNPPPTAGKRYTTEVIPAKPTTAPALPPTTGLPRLIAAPLPATASATGKLVAGFPGALPPAPGSTITSSSVASQGGHLQLTLVATAGRAASDIVAFYRAALAKYGMYDAPVPAAAGRTVVAFARGADSVTVTATPGSGGTSYVLYGAFSAAG